MNEMIERGARALCIEEHIDPDASDEWAHGVDRPNWESRIDAAQAVIRAMREPTEAMVERTYIQGASPIVTANGPMALIAHRWRLMIDEALK